MDINYLYPQYNESNWINFRPFCKSDWPIGSKEYSCANLASLILNLSGQTWCDCWNIDRENDSYISRYSPLLEVFFSIIEDLSIIGYFTVAQQTRTAVFYWVVCVTTGQETVYLGRNVFVFVPSWFLLEQHSNCGSECVAVVGARARAVKLETEIKTNDVSSPGGGA